MFVAPYFALNLAYNPFRTETRERLFERFCWPEEKLELFLQGSWQVYQILGESGWGKTQFLFGYLGALYLQEKSFYYHRLEEDQRHFRFPKDILYGVLDEAQRLYFWDRRFLFKTIQQKKMRLVIASHHDFENQFRQKKILFETLHLQPPTVSVLQHYIEQCLQSAILDPKKSVPVLAEESLEPMLKQSHYNLHKIRRFLYEFYIQLEADPEEARRCWTWLEIQQKMNLK